MPEKKLSNYLDKEGRIKDWPSKKKNKLEVLKYLSSWFQEDMFYSEHEINRIIKKASCLNDHTLLRRELIDNGFLSRTEDCMKYWKNEN